ncbi:MAG: phosphatidylglycerophosphatase A [Acidobacteria bacterium]|nr:phosphatidylglycerophosphatase A [Acidobacteriota bacterium]
MTTKHTPWATALATWFGCGFAPKAPGTVGAIGAWIPAYAALTYFQLSPQSLLIPTLILLLPSIRAATIVAEERHLKDPQIVVVDEVLGVWIAMAGASRLNVTSMIAALVLFRIFDIYKPQPVRKLESLPKGTGIIADDLMAGLYAALVLFVAGWFNLY